MSLTAEELAKRDDFAAQYRRGQQAAMQAVERAVCGCDFGGTSWATQGEADRISADLELAPGVRLLEIGAGSGYVQSQARPCSYGPTGGALQY